MSNLKGVPKKVILIANEQAYPSGLIAYADLLIRDGRVVKDRDGIANRSATSQELAGAKPLSPEEAKLALDESAWRGETPADGTRRRVIFDTLLAPDVLSNAEALDFADSIESVLSRLDIGADPYRETSPASEAMKVLDSMEIPATEGGRIFDIGERVTILADQLVNCRRELDTRQITLRDNPHIPEGAAKKLMAELAEGAGWKGTPPAEGTRRALIRDTIGEHYEATGEYAAQDRPSLALSLADRIEEALLGASFRHDERAQTIKPTPIHAQLDRAGIPRGRAVGPSVLTLSLSERVEMLIRRYVGAHPETPGEGKVPSGTRELRVVLEDVTEVDKPPEYRFVEIDNQDGASVGFPMVNSSTGSLKEIVIPYGRDDAWIGEVATQAAGAAFGVALEDHPDYVFPTERVSERVRSLLRDFDIDVDEPRAEELLEHGRQETGDALTEESPENAARRFARELIEVTQSADRLLEQREEARAGEDHWKAQRDAAFRLLQWVLPDLMGHPSDTLGADLADDVVERADQMEGAHDRNNALAFVALCIGGSMEPESPEGMGGS